MMKYLHEKDRIAIAKKGILSELSFLAHESRKMHEKRKILENHLAAKKQEFEMIKDELEQTILHEYASSQTQSSEHQKSPDLNSIAQIDRHAIQSHTFNHINNTGNEPILLTSPADFDHNLDQHATVPFKVATSPQGVSVEIFHKGLNDKKQHQLQETIEEILKNNGFKLKKVKVVI